MNALLGRIPVQAVHVANSKNPALPRSRRQEPPCPVRQAATISGKYLARSLLPARTDRHQVAVPEHQRGTRPLRLERPGGLVVGLGGDRGDRLGEHRRDRWQDRASISHPASIDRVCRRIGPNAPSSRLLHATRHARRFSHQSRRRGPLHTGPAARVAWSDDLPDASPSPSGTLHVGNLRTALLAWLFARTTGGRFWIRMENLDRTARGADVQQLADLARRWVSSGMSR